MDEFTKEFYSLESLLGKQLKLTNAYYENKIAEETIRDSMKLHNTYVKIIAKTKDNLYRAIVFTQNYTVKHELKTINPVLVDICSDIIGDIVEVSLIKAKDKRNLLLDSQSIVDGTRSNVARVAITFDMQLSECR